MVNITRFGKKSEFEVSKGNNKSNKYDSRLGDDGTKREDTGLGIEEMKYKEGEAAKDGTKNCYKSGKQKKTKVEREKTKEVKLETEQF